MDQFPQFHQPKSAIEQIAGEGVNPTLSVFETPPTQSGFLNRIRATNRIGNLSAEGYITETAQYLQEKLQGVRTQEYTGQQLMDEMPYLNFDPDETYNLTANRYRILQRRNEREYSINLEQSTLEANEGILGVGMNVLQFGSGLAGGLWGSTVGDPVGLLGGIGVGMATEGLVAVPAVGAVGGRILSKLPKTVQTGIRSGLAGTGRMGAFYRQLRLGSIENLAMTPAYAWASNSQGVNYTLADGFLDWSLGTAFQGIGGWLLPGKAHVNEAIPLVPRMKNTLDADIAKIHEAQMSIGEAASLDIGEINPSAPTEQTVVHTKERLEYASPEMNQLLLDVTPEGSATALVDLVTALEKDLEDIAILGDEVAPEGHAMRQAIVSSEAKVVKQVVKEVFPEVAEQLNLFETAHKIATKGTRSVRQGIIDAVQTPDIETRRIKLEGLLEEVEARIKEKGSRSKSSEVRESEMARYEEALKSAREEAIAQGYGKENKGAENYQGALRDYAPYKKAFDARKSASKRLREAPSDIEGEKALRDRLKAELKELNGEKAPEPVVNYGDALNEFPEGIRDVLSDKSLKSVIGRKDSPGRMNELKHKLLGSIKSNIDNLQRFLDMHEDMRKELFSEAPPEETLHAHRKLMEKARNYKNPEALITGEVEKIHQRLDYLEKVLPVEGDEAQFGKGFDKIIDENIQNARKLAEQHKEIDEQLIKHLLCVLGGG